MSIPHTGHAHACHRDMTRGAVRACGCRTCPYLLHWHLPVGLGSFCRYYPPASYAPFCIATTPPLYRLLFSPCYHLHHYTAVWHFGWRDEPTAVATYSGAFAAFPAGASSRHNFLLVRVSLRAGTDGGTVRDV